MHTRRTIGLSALQCPECGAPADVQQGSDVYHCHFCHAALAIERAHPEAPREEWHPPPHAPPTDFRESAPRAAAHRPQTTKSSSSGKPVGCILALLVLVGGGVAIGVLFSMGVLGPWNGKKPLVCSGNDRVYVDHVTAEYSDGIAIDASGNCNVTCKDCRLSAPTVIRARENATVHLDHGNADGSVFSETNDNASVTIDHTKTTGTNKTPARPSSSDPQKWPESGPFVCGEANGGTYDNVKVKVTSGAAIVGSINCSLKLSHCTIEGPVGLLLSDNASVELDHCDVRATDAVIANANGAVTIEGGTFIGKDHATLLVDNATLHAHGAQVSGSKSTSGNAEVEVE